MKKTTLALPPALPAQVLPKTGRSIKARIKRLWDIPDPVEGGGSTS